MKSWHLMCKLFELPRQIQHKLTSRTHDNAKFASCGGDKVVFIWDVASGKILRRLSGHFGKINALAFNTDAQILASGMFTIMNAAEY